MKRTICLLLAAMTVLAAGACRYKGQRTKYQGLTTNDQLLTTNYQLTVIVMDSTQALLPGAVVEAGAFRDTTSYDGRVVFKGDKAAKIKSITVTCQGYVQVTKDVQRDNVQCTMYKEQRDNVLIVKLTPVPLKEGEGGNGGTHPHLLTGALYGARYSKTAPSVTTTAVDYVTYEMEEDAIAGSEINNIPAGKLTAGEVNDFAKWYFWPSVLDSTHRRFVNTWRIAPRHRYTVQVTNKDGYPIPARAVSLLSLAGNTLFQAVTDNTGKAELWYQLIQNNLCGKHAGLKIRVDDQVQDAKEWSEGLNLFVLDEPCTSDKGTMYNVQSTSLPSPPRGEAPSPRERVGVRCNDQRPTTNDVDVMFVFDATGSMGDELRYLQAEMKDVIDRAAAATGGLSIRTGAVVYRDHGDEYLTRISRLTEDIKTTQTFIDQQRAGGGGDYPEAVPEALMAALNSAGWDENARARIAFLVLDAPCHEDSATIALLHEQVLNAAALGVRIVPVVCSGLGESGELLMRSLALATNGTSFFLTDDSGIGNTHLKPTTDSLKVEHLNDMLVRTIVEFSTMPDCEGIAEQQAAAIEEQFVPNPFNAKELEENPSVPHGEGTLYVLDVSGKLITIINGAIDRLTTDELKAKGLPVGVYFIKTFYNGKWYTQKVLVS